MELDKIDHIILEALLRDGRIAFSTIAKETNLTDVAIKKRFESLKRRNIISGITLDLNFKSLGYENPIYIQIRSEISKNKDIIKKLKTLDFILEVYHVLGDYNLFCKMIVPNLDAGEKAINQLGLIDGIIDLKTMVVLSELKKSTTLPAKTLQNSLTGKT
ncbi:MAG: Lrp/AsnC family transcriptional regulator [Candidatus ainarchaeum sp.]|nr:Lrp/AsnC family transcriptional regulator [Candidatus ainarchaeum sp.]